MREMENNGICASWNKNTGVRTPNREMISEHTSYKIPPSFRSGGKKVMLLEMHFLLIL